MIKGSLLMSLPIMKPFGRKFYKFKYGSKNWRYLGFDFSKILVLQLGPLGHQSSPNHVVWHKNGGDTPRNVFSRAWQAVSKYIYINIKKTLNMIFHPYTGAALLNRFSQFLAWGSYRWPNHPRQSSSRYQNSGVSPFPVYQVACMHYIVIL